MVPPRHAAAARIASAVLAVTVGMLGLSACTAGPSPSPTSSAGASSGKTATSGSGTVADDATVATVNGHKIDGATYNSVLAQVHAQAQQQAQQGQGAQAPTAKQEKQQAITAVVGDELLKLDATKHGYTASKSDVDTQVQQTKKQYGSTAKFTKALKSNHLTLKRYRAQIAEQIQITAYVDKELGPFTVTDAQITQTYDQQKKLYEQEQKQQEKQGGATSTPQPIPSLKDVRSQIKQQLQLQQQQQAVSKRVSALKKKATVKVLI